MGHGEIKDTNCRVGLVMPKSTRQKLDDYATSTGKTLTGIVLEAIGEYFEHHRDDEIIEIDGIKLTRSQLERASRMVSGRED